MTDEDAEITHTEKGVPAGAATPQPGGRYNAISVHETVEMRPSSSEGKVEESTTSNVMEIVGRAGMGTVNRDLDIPLPLNVFLAPVLYDDDEEGESDEMLKQGPWIDISALEREELLCGSFLQK